MRDVTGTLVFSCFSAFLGAVCFGWNTGVINNPKASIVQLINSTVLRRYSSQISDYGIDVLWSVVVSIFAVGGMGGALISGLVADRLGRKAGMLANCGVGLTAALLMGLSQLAGSFEMLVAGRLLVGFCSALYTGLVPVYLTEIAPRRLRGGIGVLNQLGVVVGLFLSQAFSIDELLGGRRLWPLLLGLSGLPSLLQLLCLPWCPESPRHLLITRSDEAGATDSLLRLRGGADVDKELSEMQSEAASDTAGSSSSSRQHRAGLLRLCRQWRPLLVGIVLHLSQQLSGINVIFYYSSELFVGVGASESAAKYATMGVGGIMIGMTLVSIPLMDRAGRRTLHLSGLLGICVSSATFSLLYSLGSARRVDGVVPAAYAWSSVAFALLVVVFFAVGPGSIPWMLMSEMFGQEWRAPANAVGVLVNWLANFAVGMLFPVLLKSLTTLVFLPFTVLTAVFLAFLFFRMPETKGRSIEDVTRVFFSRGAVAPDADAHDGSRDDDEEKAIVVGRQGSVYT